MRDIKFRGLGSDGRWVHGYYVYTNRGIDHKPSTHSKHWIISEAFGNGGYFNASSRTYIKNAETIGQFTGLYDKNGKEVYESDVVRIIGGESHKGYREINEICLVEYCGIGFSFKRIKDNVYFDYGFTTIDEIVVIGNIYENPNLLEQK